MTETLWRSTFEIGETVGRTLSGMALPFDRPTRVQDVKGGPFPGRPYTEAHGPASFDVSLRQHPAGFPVFYAHAYQYDPIAEPLGTVTYRRSDAESALLFEAVLSRTIAADEKLTLVNDGSMRSVSVGIRPIQHVMRGDVVYRTESAMRELSLAPTGFGQYEDALVSSVRTELDDVDVVAAPVLAALQRRRARLRGI